MNDSEARFYLDLVDKSGILTKLFENDSWLELEFSSLERAALSAWKFIVKLRPDIAVGLYPDLFKQEYLLLEMFFDEVIGIPYAVFCPDCGKGWLIPAFEEDIDSPADCTYCKKNFTSEELDSLDI